MNDEELRRALDAYRVPDVPADLADRVLAGTGRRPRREARRGWMAALIVVAGVAAAVVAVLILAPGERSSGQLLSVRRASASIGDRGVAVAEAGAELEWTVARGAARVTQRVGDVFYRVEPGGPFVVETPAGTVEVRGTCFRVEVETMKLSRQHIVAAGVGAAVAAVVIVTVYEGRVLLAGPRGAVTVEAGERARAETGMAPEALPATPPAPPPASSAVAGGDSLAVREVAVRRELAAAQTRIAALESQLATAAAAPPAFESPVDPTPEQLRAWAARCEIRLDAPGIFGATARPRPDELEELGLGAAERPAFERAVAALHERTRAPMRAIYVEAPGDAAGGDELTAGAMLSEISSKALRADGVRARARMARERAGLQPPPADVAALPPVERALRLIYSSGNELERMLAEDLGAARARELRKHHGGWPGLRYNDAGCEEGDR